MAFDLSIDDSVANLWQVAVFRESVYNTIIQISINKNEPTQTPIRAFFIKHT